MHEVDCCECGGKIISELPMPQGVDVVCAMCCFASVTEFSDPRIASLYQPSDN